MPLLSLEELTYDPDFGQEVTILRSSGLFGPGGWQEQVTQIETFGIVAPADNRALEQIPEGDRVTGSMQLICACPIYETQARRSGLSDKIVWNDETYRVQNVSPYKDFGFWSAILVRIEGN